MRFTFRRRAGNSSEFSSWNRWKKNEQHIYLWRSCGSDYVHKVLMEHSHLFNYAIDIYIILYILYTCGREGVCGCVCLRVYERIRESVHVAWVPHINKPKHEDTSLVDVYRLKNLHRWCCWLLFVFFLFISLFISYSIVWTCGEFGSWVTADKYFKCPKDILICN